MLCKAIRPSESSSYDKVVKVFTLVFALFAVALSIAISVLHSEISVHSNNSAYTDQIGLLDYVSKNVNATPVKNIYFRDLRCDDAEETVTLFPWTGNKTLNYWGSQLLCIERYQTINYTDSQGSCEPTITQCGEYCIPPSEGTTCPITKISITSSVTGNPDQTLSSNRGLYLTRDASSSQGIYRIEVDVDAFPCQNDARRNLGGLGQTIGVTDPELELCDENGYDTVNSQRIEQVPFKRFLDDNANKLRLTYPATAVTTSSVAYLTQRSQILYKHSNSECSQIESNKILDIQDYADNVEQIGNSFVYMIIKAILCILLFVIFITELIVLKGKIHIDLKIVTVLYKIITIILMTFFLIEGGLIIHQINLKQDIENYFISFADAGCFTQSSVSILFSDFPNLFSDDLSIFIQYFFICMIIMGFLEGILVIFFIIQMVRWCLTRRHQLKPRKYVDTEFNKVKQQEVQMTEGQPIATDRVQHTSLTPQFETTLNMKHRSKKY